MHNINHYQCLLFIHHWHKLSTQMIHTQRPHLYIPYIYVRMCVCTCACVYMYVCVCSRSHCTATQNNPPYSHNILDKCQYIKINQWHDNIQVITARDAIWCSQPLLPYYYYSSHAVYGHTQSNVLVMSTSLFHHTIIKQNLTIYGYLNTPNKQLMLDEFLFLSNSILTGRTGLISETDSPFLGPYKFEIIIVPWGGCL